MSSCGIILRCDGRRCRFGYGSDAVSLITADSALDPAGRWSAALALRYALVKEKTVLMQRAHRGPLFVQRPFYPEGDAVCHTYLLHPPGGIVGGDALETRIDVESGGQVLLT